MLTLLLCIWAMSYEGIMLGCGGHLAAMRKDNTEAIKRAEWKDQKIPSASVGKQNHCKHNENNGFIIRILDLT